MAQYLDIMTLINTLLACASIARCGIAEPVQQSASATGQATGPRGLHVICKMNAPGFPISYKWLTATTVLVTSGDVFGLNEYTVDIATGQSDKVPLWDHYSAKAPLRSSVASSAVAWIAGQKWGNESLAFAKLPDSRPIFVPIGPWLTDMPVLFHDASGYDIRFLGFDGRTLKEFTLHIGDREGQLTDGSIRTVAESRQSDRPFTVSGCPLLIGRLADGALTSLLLGPDRDAATASIVTLRQFGDRLTFERSAVNLPAAALIHECAVCGDHLVWLLETPDDPMKGVRQLWMTNLIGGQANLLSSLPGSADENARSLQPIPNSNTVSFLFANKLYRLDLPK